MRTFIFTGVLMSVVVKQCVSKAVPANIAALKASIIAQGKCAKPLKTGFYASDEGGDSK
jgi:hypothetical protein